MKLHKLIVVVAVAAATLMSFTLKDGEYKVDTTKSKLTWLGKKVTGEHTGAITVSEGTLMTKSKKITGGSFAIDMTSITCTDVTNPGANEKLVGHLKSDDFFGSEKFPKANFVITKVTGGEKDQYTIKGNLTIKGITNEIEFPATVSLAGGDIVAKAKIVVDRTKYDIKYRSGNFFTDLGDKAIYDEFELNVELVANQGV